MLNENLAWLAGLVDGEGCFAVQVHEYRGILEFCTTFTLDLNTGSWYNKATEILNFNGIAFSSLSNTPSRINTQKIYVRRASSLVKLCTLLEPFATVKLPHVQHFKKLAYLTGMKKSFHIGNSKTVVNWPAVNNWVSFIDESRRLNSNRGKTKWTGADIKKFYRDRR